MGCFSATSYQSLSHSILMGAVRSRPEPEVEHLAKGHGQLWEHSCKQFSHANGKVGSCIHASLTSFKGWQMKGKHLYLEIVFCGSFW